MQPTYYVKHPDGSFTQAEHQPTLMPKDEEIIPNWSMFDANCVIIDLFKHQTDEGVIYNPHLSFHLNDSEEMSEQQVVSITTDIFEDNIDDALSAAVDSVSTLFDHVADVVTIYDANGSTIGELSIDKFYADECCNCGCCKSE